MAPYCTWLGLSRLLHLHAPAANESSAVCTLDTLDGCWVRGSVWGGGLSVLPWLLECLIKVVGMFRMRYGCKYQMT
jgi:hypothetical protein